MDRMKFAIVILIVGILTTLISTTADLTGLGTYDGIGPYQLIVIFVGVALIVMGTILIIRHNKRSN